jgi:AcrR family transcriptional regulator
LLASTEAIGSITPDAAGWQQLRAWIERHADTYGRYEPVFLAFQAAAESDQAVASGAARIGERDVAVLQAKLSGWELPARHAAPVIALLLECITRTQRVAGVLRWPRQRVIDAVTDAVHRTAFGFDADVNVHPPTSRRPPRLRLPTFATDADTNATRAALLDAGHDVLVTRGYHGSRVDDIVEAAGLSHGVFYRYFDNKEHLVRVLAGRAMQTVSLAFGAVPALDGDRTALRRWLRRYNTTYASEAAMIRVWVDATAGDPALQAESAAALDWGRRRLARTLAPRGFGDVDTEAVVMVALLDAFVARRQDPSAVSAAATVIERGLYGAADVGRRR